MTVHFFQCYIGRGPMSVSDLEARINDWVSSNGEWANDTVDHTLREYRALDGSLICHSVPVRFVENDTKSNLYQKFTDKLKEKVDWWRVGYHTCHSDQDPHDMCTFDANEDPTAVARDQTYNGATIPAAVPEFPRSAYNNTL